MPRVTVQVPRAKNNCLLFSLLIAGLAFGCKSSANSSLVARIDGKPIYADEFRSRLREYQVSETPDEGSQSADLPLRNRILNEMLEEKIMMDEADRRKIEVSVEELDHALKQVEAEYPGNSFDELLAEKLMTRARWRDRMRSKLVLQKVVESIFRDVPFPNDAEIQIYYTKNLERFRREARNRVQQIVVTTKEEGEHVLSELGKGQSFEELAKQYSITPEAEEGGDLGFVQKGVLPKAVEEAISKLREDQTSGLIKSDYGFHVVRLLLRKPAREQSIEEARPTIARILLEKKREKHFTQWREGVLSNAKIERNHALLSKIQ